MPPPFRTVAVLGAGTMGAQIAAHLANAGVNVLLFDMTREAASAGLERLRTTRPDPCFTPDVLSRITTGAFETDAARLTDAEWIIEAVVESLDVKAALLTELALQFDDHAIVTTNTSGIPIAAIAATFAPDLKRRWLGTHFFNPPRYLRLLEIIPTPDTDPAVTARIADFADRHLGKGVVMAKDTPGFIANRIGIFAALRAVEAVAYGDFTIEEVDAITGPIIGRPKSATFRTLDIAGLDVFTRVARDLATSLLEVSRDTDYAVPALLTRMVAKGLLGVKTGAGFYKRVSSDPGSDILSIDPDTLEYSQPAPVTLPSLEAVRSIDDTGRRLRTLFLGTDRVGDFLRRTLGPTLLYSARLAPEIAHCPADVDRAMRLGFGWELGPFEMWHAIGVAGILDGSGITAVPPTVEQSAHAAKTSAHVSMTAAKSRGVVTSNAGASLIDLGDGVLGVEFHSKMNALGGDAITMLRAGVDEASRNFQAMVIANDAVNFSAGANLMLLLLEAQEGNWDEVDGMVRAFQSATMALKTSSVPVVVAPAGLALGGGCEVCLHGAHVRSAAEIYMGLVEAGVGLIPAGGGTKEMLLRAIDRAGPSDAFPFVREVFETIGFGKVSTSAPDARRLGYLRTSDTFTMNRERLIDDAKRDALMLATAGYQPVRPRTSIRIGGADTYAALTLGVHLAHRAGRLSDHDALIGRKIARVLAGGEAPRDLVTTEQTLLDLEREAFLGLCGEPRTQARIAYTLKTGKTLRN